MMAGEVEQLIKDVAAQGAVLQKLDGTMEEVVKTQSQVAVLLEKMREDREDKMDLFERMRTNESSIQLLTQQLESLEKREDKRIDFRNKVLASVLVVLIIAGLTALGLKL